MTLHTFEETVQFLFSLGPELKTVKWDLERIRALLRQLNNPEERCRYIHVAGTNGKGSTCAMLASALRVAGFRTGLYTSPHLIDPRERIQIDGQPVGEANGSSFSRKFMQRPKTCWRGRKSTPIRVSSKR